MLLMLISCSLATFDECIIYYCIEKNSAWILLKTVSTNVVSTLLSSCHVRCFQTTIHTAYKLIETYFCSVRHSIKQNAHKNHDGSYDDCRHINLFSIKTLQTLKINVKALARVWFASAMPARISSRFLSRHWKTKKKTGHKQRNALNAVNVVFFQRLTVELSKAEEIAKLFSMHPEFSLPDTCCLRQVDRDIRTRNSVHRHGNSCKTTTKQHIWKKKT